MIQLNDGAVAAAPLVLSLVFAFSALGKIARPAETFATLQRLRLPRFVVRRPLATVFPWLEISIAIGILAPVPQVAAITAGVALAGCVGFVIVVGRMLLRGSPASCGCFGHRDTEPVSIVTLTRNLALLAAATISAGLMFTGATFWSSLEQFVDDDFTWFFAVVATTLALLARLAERMRASAGPPSREAAAGLERAAGSLPLRQGESPVPVDRSTLLLVIKADCRYCEPVVTSVPAWRRLLGSHVELAIASDSDPASLAASYPEIAAEVRTITRAARDALGVAGAPALVRLAPPGVVVEPPAHGRERIEHLVRETLSGLPS